MWNLSYTSKYGGWNTISGISTLYMNWLVRKLNESKRAIVIEWVG